MKIGLIAALGLCVLAGGCVTSVAEQQALDAERCRSYGFRNSEAVAQCRLEIDLARSADRRAWLQRDFGPGYGFGYGYGRFRRW